MLICQDINSKESESLRAIVTGGNKGIGLEISKRLITHGFEVHSLSRSKPTNTIENLVSWEVDISDYDHALEIIRKIGSVDVFINNAGYMNAKTANDYNDQEILHILNVNLISAIKISTYLAQQMANREGGRIISIGSIAGEIGHPDIWYGISKAGLMNGMRSLAKTFGAKGVIVNSVAPGPVVTDMMKNIPLDRQARLKSSTIEQRFCTATEVADVVLWLATSAPSFINGDVIDINNGSNYR